MVIAVAHDTEGTVLHGKEVHASSGSYYSDRDDRWVSSEHGKFCSAESDAVCCEELRYSCRLQYSWFPEMNWAPNKYPITSII